MTRYASISRVRIAVIGAGKVSDYHHVPGIALDPRAEERDDAGHGEPLDVGDEEAAAPQRAG